MQGFDIDNGKGKTKEKKAKGFKEEEVYHGWDLMRGRRSNCDRESCNGGVFKIMEIGKLQLYCIFFLVRSF